MDLLLTKDIQKCLVIWSMHSFGDLPTIDLQKKWVKGPGIQCLIYLRHTGRAGAITLEALPQDVCQRCHLFVLGYRISATYETTFWLLFPM